MPLVMLWVRKLLSRLGKKIWWNVDVVCRELNLGSASDIWRPWCTEMRAMMMRYRAWPGPIERLKLGALLCCVLFSLGTDVIVSPIGSSQEIAVTLDWCKHFCFHGSSHSPTLLPKYLPCVNCTCLACQALEFPKGVWAQTLLAWPVGFNLTLKYLVSISLTKWISNVRIRGLIEKMFRFNHLSLRIRGGQRGITPHP